MANLKLIFSSKLIIILLLHCLQLVVVASHPQPSTLKEKLKKGGGVSSQKFSKDVTDDLDVSVNSLDSDQLSSNSVLNTRAASASSQILVASPQEIPDSVAVEAAFPPPTAGAGRPPIPGPGKGDLKGADTFGLGYYLPIVGPTIVRYHPYPFVYYPTATYLHPSYHTAHHHHPGFGGITSFYPHSNHHVHQVQAQAQVHLGRSRHHHVVHGVLH